MAITHKIFWDFPLLIIILLSSCGSSNQENFQSAGDEIDTIVQEPEEEESEENMDDEYNMNLEFVMDSECNLTDKYFDLDYSDPRYISW